MSERRAYRSLRTLRKLSNPNLQKEIASFWEGNPCGAAPHQLRHPALSGIELYTEEFYQRMTHLRYSEHPYIPNAFEFRLHGGEKTLEVGCGLGTDLCEFAKNEADVVGVDFTKIAVQTTRHRLDVLGLTGEVLKADATRLPFDDASFDFVYSNGVLHHIPDMAGAISEIRRVLRPDGRAIVMLYNLHSLHFYWWVLGVQGLARLGFFKFRSVSRLISESTDGAGNPVSHMYSRRAIKRLFKVFSEVDIQTFHVAHGLLMPKIGKRVSRTSLPRPLIWLLTLLEKRLGFHHVVKLTR